MEPSVNKTVINGQCLFRSEISLLKEDTARKNKTQTAEISERK